MDIKQLRYFYTIAQQGQITRAAKILHMAQPPLSQQLKHLEDELDVVLFERNGRKMELTQAGIILFKKVERILLELEEMKTEVKETNEGLKGNLAIGVVKSCFSYIPDRIRMFRNTYPNVTFSLREGDSYMIEQSIKSRQSEVGIVRLPVEMKALCKIPLPKEPFVAIFPSNASVVPLKNTIKMNELATTPLLLLHRIRGTGQYEMVIEECRRAGFEPNIICDCPDVSMLLSLVSQGLGASIIPESALLSFPTPNVQVIQIEDTTLYAESAVIWLKDRYLSKQAKRFIETFESFSV